ncbi:nitrogen fixation protein NifZ [Teredinibacter haidensis]|uniref:nitrogen fixation protein NifZ n=1 Tax=Teredinibacter haidensis TaxID=2731755 RepID=UPI0009491F9F|nr:nitrogen fixation protein NifZ [Teredinibacter haidensis]
MLPAYEYGSEVRLIRNVRNDGTYPGMGRGELLVKRGSVGCVYDVGTFLQDQIIYRVHFLDEEKTVGCREEELLPVSAPWIPNRYEFNEKVLSRIALSVAGEVVVAADTLGTVMKVLRDVPGGIQYHVTFGSERLFQIPEAALASHDSDEE